MQNILRWAILPIVMIPFLPSELAAAPGYCSSYPTTIESITPQAAIAGVTKVYVLGTCFGDTQGSGSVSINGTIADVSLWSDGEIVFTVPFTATTGNLVITSSTYGSDSSANEADCANAGWCGTANINPDFYVNAPSAPPFYLSPTDVRIAGTPSQPEYVTGEWNYDDGFGDTATYDLTQLSQNSDGTWTVTGSVHWTYGSPDDTCDQSLTGTLDDSGHLILNVAPHLEQGCDSYSDEYAILSSGDLTSQGYFYFDDGYGYNTPPPLPDFPNNLGDENNDFPLINTVFDDKPASETPTAQGWAAIPGSDYPTQGLFDRSLPTFPGFVEFAGRFVYEQDGGQAFDGCYVSDSITREFTGVTGGGWYVDNGGDWGPDTIGIWSQGVDWYQEHEPDGCTITVPQSMNINTGDDVLTEYTTNQLVIKIWSNEVCTEVETQDSQTVKQGLAYPPAPGTDEGHTCVNDQ